MTGKTKGLIALGVAVLAVAALAWAGSESKPRESGLPKPVIQEAIKGEQCVEDTDYMRRNHMVLLEEEGDRVKIDGIRGGKHSLKGCIDCHASPTSGSVAKFETDFCISCHTFTAVEVNCFQCHATKPEGPMIMHSMDAETAHYKHKLAAGASQPIGVEEMVKVAQ